MGDDDVATGRLNDKVVETLNALVEATKTGAIKPKNLLKAKGIMVLNTTKGAALLGVEHGHGVAFKILGDANPDGSLKLSSPLIMKLNKFGVGLQLRYTKIHTLIIMHTDKQVEQLASTDFVMGTDVAYNGMIGGSTSGAHHESAINTATGHAEALTGDAEAPQVLSVADQMLVVDASLYAGTVNVDKDAMRAAYGGDYTAEEVLSGRVNVPNSLFTTANSAGYVLGRLAKM